MQIEPHDHWTSISVGTCIESTYHANRYSYNEPSPVELATHAHTSLNHNFKLTVRGLVSRLFLMHPPPQ